MAFCTAANICGPLWAPKLFWVCRRAQGGSRPKLGCDPSPIAQCSLALGGISPGSWAYQCTCICACSVTKYMPCITPKIYFGHLIAVGMRCAIVVVAKPLFLISSQLISCGTPIWDRQFWGILVYWWNGAGFGPQAKLRLFSLHHDATFILQSLLETTKSWWTIQLSKA